MGRLRRKHLSLPTHMHQKGKNFYYVILQAGKRKWIPLGQDLAQARLKWAELENIADEDLTHVTFSVAAARYNRDVLPTKKPKTQDEYARQLHNLVQVFGNVPLDHITPQHIRRYLDARTGKVAANREKALFSTVFNHAREWGYTSAANPCAGVRGHKESGRNRYIEDLEFLKVYEQACRPLKDAMDLAYYTGQRPSDVLKLKKSDLREGALWIRQNKTNTPLRVEVDGPLLDAIVRITTEPMALPPGAVRSQYLVQSETGERLTLASLRNRFNKACAKAGVMDFQFRDIRAKAATDTEEIGGLGHAQRLLGHQTRSMTEHYVKDRVGFKVAPTPKVIKPKKKTG